MLCFCSCDYSRTNSSHKLFDTTARRQLTPISLVLAFLLTFSAPVLAANKAVINQAAKVVFDHTGVHTHANYLLFDTGTRDLLAMRQDTANYPHLVLIAHSSLPTDRAALPPDLAAFSSPGDPPLDNPYGSIDGGLGKPGWSLQPLHQNGKNWVKVLAPTRFANWLALQSPARRKQYFMPRHYSLVITWATPGG